MTTEEQVAHYQAYRQAEVQKESLLDELKCTSDQLARAQIEAKIAELSATAEKEFDLFWQIDSALEDEWERLNGGEM